MINKQAIKNFTDSMTKLGYEEDYINIQINLVNQGIRDSRLHDNCIILLDNLTK